MYDYLNGTDMLDYKPHNASSLGVSVSYYVVQVLHGIVCIVGLTGNALVMYVILRCPTMRTITNWYILNLAAADSLFLLGIPVLMVTMSLGFWPFGNVACKVYMSVTSINQFTSSLLLMIMSADRYVAVCHPIWSPSLRTSVIAKGVSSSAWAVSFAMIAPIFLYASSQQVTVNHPPSSTAPPSVLGEESSARDSGINDTNAWRNDHREMCNIYWPENHLMDRQTSFTLYTFILAFAVPLALILLFYILVVHKLRTACPVGSNQTQHKRRSYRKVTRLVVAVVACYVACWLPYWLLQLSLIFVSQSEALEHESHSAMVTLCLLAGCLTYSNSAINPILYVFVSENFKHSFSKTIAPYCLRFERFCQTCTERRREADDTFQQQRTRDPVSP